MNIINTTKSNGSLINHDQFPSENFKEVYENSLFKNLITNDIEDEENYEKL